MSEPTPEQMRCGCALYGPPALCTCGTCIKTSFVYPPIPIRSMDWCAYLDGQEESGNYGWGHTEQEAIRDLFDNYN